MARNTWMIPACVLLATPAFGQDGIPEKKLAELKAATAFLRVEENDGTTTGSAFLIQADGETGFVATNHHVVASAARSKTRKIELVFWSGTLKERAVEAEFMGSDPEKDLAILKVKMTGLPAPLDLSQSVKLRETMTVYTFGFPLGQLLASNGENPAVTVGKGTIGSLHEDGQGKLTRVQLDGELNPGNSGGPVVTAEGGLVGIAVSKVLGTKISFAIPPAELTAMMKGHIGTPIVRTVRVDGTGSEFEVEVPVTDPLQKFKSIDIRYIRKESLKVAPKADGDDNWADLAGSGKVKATVEGGKAIAHFTVKSTSKKAFDYYFQTTYTTADEKTVGTQPVIREIQFGSISGPRSGSSSGTGSIAGNGNRNSSGSKREPWETITSKEGGFTIDVPVKPTESRTMTRQSEYGPIRLFILGCEAKRGQYVAFRLDTPFAVRANQVEQILDIERDIFAEYWNGKVLTEKKVLLAGNEPGRDFTIRGNPENHGASTIRMRMYFVGRSVFALAVVSPANRDLPEDTGRFLGSLAIGETKIRVNGNPEPEPKGTQLEGWGLAIDPDGDCKFTPGSKSMTIEIPAALHDFGGPLLKFNAPRAMREVNGDFAATVKVSGDFRPGPRSTTPKSYPYVSGGLLIWSDSHNLIRLERAAVLHGQSKVTTVAFEEYEGGYAGAVHNERIQDGDCYLRLERKGSRIFGGISRDGSNWNMLKPIDTVWPDKLKIGVMAISTSSSPFAVKLEGFDLQADGR